MSEMNVSSDDATSWVDLGQSMWDYLTGKGAAINYEFQDMKVDVPKTTGESAESARWRLDGTLRITTSENAS